MQIKALAWLFPDSANRGDPMTHSCFRLLLAGMLCTAASFAIADVPELNSDSAVQSRPNGEAAGDVALLQEFKCVAAVLGYQYATAEKACTAAISLTPASPLGYKFLGLNHLLQHQYERAEPDFLIAIKLDPKDAENQAGYAQALSGQGRFAEAVKQFGIALKITPHDVRILGARCWARAGDGKNLNKALADCNLSLKLDPRFAVGYDSRALVYLRQGRYALSLHDYSRSLSLAPDRPTALFGRGIAEIHLNQLPAAGRDILLARQIDPDIDAIFAQVGILSAGCKEKQGPCVLPDDLKPKTLPPYISVSYQIKSAARTFNDAEAVAFDFSRIAAQPGADHHGK
jgi:tetratricopeptide (TPR) repeat protein